VGQFKLLAGLPQPAAHAGLAIEAIFSFDFWCKICCLQFALMQYTLKMQHNDNRRQHDNDDRRQPTDNRQHEHDSFDSIKLEAAIPHCSLLRG
jgi:hypothetical protein